MVVAAEKHTCFYCTTYVMRKQFGFFLASNVITRNANNISLGE